MSSFSLHEAAAKGREFEIPSDDQIKEAEKNFRVDQGSLMWVNATNMTFHPKVCTLCDRFIEAYDQKLLNMEFLLLPSMVKRLSWESVKQNIEETHKDENNPDWNIADTVNRYYALQSHVLDQLPKLNTAQKRTLKKLILSPNSYVRKNHYKDKCLGCCGECFKGFEHMKQN